ncbi:GAF domain-containing protein [Limnothrix sp. FACHB-881]|uniref:GAF domain-containing sensor histidine kinase n=2 Tax=Limnothrix TaxID=132605 RepID=UPI00168729E3|nr:ATP-binding protein [Limnothrix sp. FACHB-881]MBD2636653.1 GAF domain-containing protein [Limnothrix sp. FACHB-881]
MQFSPLQVADLYPVSDSVQGKTIPLIYHQNLVALADGQNHILELIAQGQPLETVLTELALLIEAHTSCQTFCAFLLLEAETQRLRHGAAPSLPPDYNQCIDGIPIGPAVGSCGTAAYHKASVIVEDIAIDPLWAEFRDLAIGFGLRACWSTPILSCEGQVLGTFAMYNPFPHRPHPHDRKLLIKATYLARVAIERHQTEKALQAANEDLERQVTKRTQDLQLVVTRLQREMQERKRVEDQLRQRTIELEATLDELKKAQLWMVQSEKMSSLGQLVAGMAHEINNPVNFIHGNLNHVQSHVELLLGWTEKLRNWAQSSSCAKHPELVRMIADLDEESDFEFIQEDLPKILSSMNLGTERIRQIILSLRNFSRMDEACYKPVNIHEGIDSTLAILQHRMKAAPDHPEIQVKCDYGDLPAVECYASNLNQVFMNLLANAIEAITEKYQVDPLDATNPDSSVRGQFKGCIEIQTRLLRGDRVQIQITDNGVGMPDSIQSQIFNPFFTTKPVGKGTGLGMSISYQIVTEQHQGQLRFSSVPGAGSTFTIVMPLKQEGQST